jgi:hypothetical protein
MSHGRIATSQSAGFELSNLEGLNGSKVSGQLKSLVQVSEEYDPLERRLVGNFPQALSHVSHGKQSVARCRTSRRPPAQLSASDQQRRALTPISI